VNDEQRIAALESAVSALGQYVYELASMAEHTGYALSALRDRPNVVINVLVVVGDRADGGGWRVVCDSLESGESSF